MFTQYSFWLSCSAEGPVLFKGQDGFYRSECGRFIARGGPVVGTTIHSLAREGFKDDQVFTDEQGGLYGVRQVSPKAVA